MSTVIATSRMHRSRCARKKYGEVKECGSFAFQRLSNDAADCSNMRLPFTSPGQGSTSDIHMPT